VPSEQESSTLSRRLDKLYEFEREPISADKLHSGRYFAGMFAGEHVAATEFVIGALFVQWGAGARDLIWGLVLGNLLAVLSWAFICSPIAVQTRLTLYWYVRRIIGPGLTVVYNFVNALLYCCLAAAMIGVSASAVILALSKIPKIGIDITHPSFEDVYPNSFGWVVTVLLVGVVVIALAILGFKKLSQFASVCSPWMFSIFVAGALASLPALGDIRNLADLQDLARTKVWTGVPYENPLRAIASALPDQARNAQVPPALRAELEKEGAGKDEKSISLSDSAVFSVETPGSRWRITDQGTEYVIKRVVTEQGGEEKAELTICQVLEKLGFWHIAFFAWFCNLAMHVGLSDMAIFRYARHWTYGFYSAFGMYLGHFVAWICAGVMGAVVGGGLNPGQMADTSAGMAGMIAVLIAGWTTANPTIYRAGLALQIVTPNWPRWKITLAAGGVTAIVGCFPAIFMQLLNFVAIYGLMLMPIGAVIVVEHWLFPRIGLRRYWTEKRGLTLNVPALVSWLTVLVICFPIEKFTNLRSPMELLGVHLFFRWLPGWFIAAGLYAVICYAGAGSLGTRGPDEEAARAPAAPVRPAGSASPTGRARPLSPAAWIAGAVALLALIMCVILPLRVFIGGAVPETYETNLANYKGQLLIATIIYFIAATVWFSYREKARSTA